MSLSKKINTSTVKRKKEQKAKGTEKHYDITFLR